MALAAASTILISLLIMGIFMILVTNLNYLVERAKSEIQLRIFLSPDTSVDEAMGLREEIAGYRRQGVRRVRFVSKEEAAAQVERTWDVPKLFSGLGDNPLPDALVVQLDRGARIDSLIKKLNALPGVEEVVYRDFIRTLVLVAQVCWVIGVSLILVVSLGVLYIVVNTIRLTVFARRREIEIMKLVGATNWFIRWPFILEGLLLGLIGACLGTVVLSKGYYFLFKSVHQLGVIPLAPEMRVNDQLLLTIFPAGVFFGLAGSLLSVKKFLREYA